MGGHGEEGPDKEFNRTALPVQVIKSINPLMLTNGITLDIAVNQL
jgi:hypothetical protein